MIITVYTKVSYTEWFSRKGRSVIAWLPAGGVAIESNKKKHKWSS